MLWMTRIKPTLMDVGFLLSVKMVSQLNIETVLQILILLLTLAAAALRLVTDVRQARASRKKGLKPEREKDYA